MTQVGPEPRANGQAFLSDRERRILLALCEALLPDGKIFIGGDERTARKAEAIIASGKAGVGLPEA